MKMGLGDRVSGDEWGARLRCIAFFATLVVVSSLVVNQEVYYQRLIANALYMTCTALAACAALRWVGWPSHRGALSALVLGVGLTFTFGGDVAWAWYELVLETETPFPSIADFFYVTSYALIMVGVLLLPTKPMSLVLRGRIFIDGLITVLSVVTLSWYFYLGPVVTDTEATALTYAVSVSYPIVDVLLIACLYSLSNHGGHPRLRRAVGSLQVSLAILVICDSIYGVTGLHGFYPLVLDGPYAFAYGLMGVSAMDVAWVNTRTLPKEDPVDAARELTFWRTMLPYALCLALGGLLAYVLVYDRESEFANGVYLGATVCIVIVLVRQMIALRENLRLYQELHATAQQLQQLAATDGMTGLANHRTMQEVLSQVMATTAEPPRCVSMLLIDVDEFKAYNDAFGHLAGDEVLRQVADVLRSNVRPGEVPARYGGEEFAVVLPGADNVAATRVAERIRAAVEIHTFPSRRITVSIGVATATEAASCPSDLVHAADRALYQAKHTGRNRVVTATPLTTARRVA